MMRTPARSTLSRRALLFGALVAQLLASAMAPAAAEYRLSAGDVVELSVVGLPDMRQRSQVDLDGKVSLPLVGAIQAAGLPLTELRAKIQELIARKAVRQRTDGGRELPVVIEPDEVTLNIAEYRPVYVNGDVSKPGEVPFRSDMTVRQAVALAGGYDVMRFRINNPFIQAADLESDLKTFAAEHFRQQTRIARLETELKTLSDIPPQTAGLRAPVAPALVAQIRDLETEQFKLRAADLARERASLQTLIRFGEVELLSLSVQREREAEGAKVDEEDFKRISGLFDKGNVPITRLTDTRRIVLLSSTRLLQTGVQIERVRRERELDLRKLQKLDDDRRLEVARELQDARVQLASTGAKIEAASDKLLYTATVRSQLVRGTGGRPDLMVVRRQESGQRRSFAADEDTELRPGDVVEVSLVSDFKPSDANAPQDARKPADANAPQEDARKPADSNPPQDARKPAVTPPPTSRSPRPRA